MRVTSGESEPERRRRTPLPLVSPRSTKEKKRAVRPSTRSPDEPEKIPRYSCVLGVREFMAVLAVIGPLGTLISLWVLPQGELMDQLPSMRARHMRNRGEGKACVEQTDGWSHRVQTHFVWPWDRRYYEHLLWFLY